MNIAFSNIGWPKEMDKPVSELLKQAGITRLEIAPTRSFYGVEDITSEMLTAEQNFWKENNISIVAMQSLLFGKPELQLFGSTGSRNALFEHLVKLYKVASILGASKLVFGSPKNREVPQNLDQQDAWDLAVSFFKKAGVAANDFGLDLCLEPNPTLYGCNFITNAADGLRLVRDVATNGFKLHLDTACMALSGDNVEKSICDAGELLAHFHVSAPGLGPLEEYFVDHQASINALRKIDYSGTVSVEMRPNINPNSISSIQSAISLVQKFYQSH